MIFYLFFILLPLTTADDGATILKLASSVTPLPSSWSTTSSANICKWDGIKCDSSNTRVTSINLAKQSLSGTLPSELNALTELQSLSLQSNSLSGDFLLLSDPSKLQSLFLDNKNFTKMPSGFFKGLVSLQVFSVGYNSFGSWELGDDVGECTGLVTFSASNANIAGSIPDVFGNLNSFQNLRLSYNNLTGVLSMANFGIQNLWLNNQLFGLSSSIDVLASMTSFWGSQTI